MMMVEELKGSKVLMYQTFDSFTEVSIDVEVASLAAAVFLLRLETR